jgi:mannosyltransferase OCH1-like enzyme
MPPPRRVRFITLGVVSVLLAAFHVMTILYKGRRLDTFSANVVSRKAILIRSGSASGDEDISDDGRHHQQQQQLHSCPEAFGYFRDHDVLLSRRSMNHTTGTTDTNNASTTRMKIPRVIHMVSYSRCLTKRSWTMASALVQIHGGSYSIHLHDMAVVDKLLLQQDEFSADLADYLPHLSLYLNACLPLFGDDHSRFQVKTNLFKYLVLWNSGGIFVDLGIEDDEMMNASDGLLLLNKYSQQARP